MCLSKIFLQPRSSTFLSHNTQAITPFHPPLIHMAYITSLFIQQMLQFFNDYADLIQG